MKPRFTILTLLGVTAYVAVNIAGISNPLSNWFQAAVLAFYVTMIYLTVRSMEPATNVHVKIARVILACSFLYYYIGTSRGGAPHEWLAELLLSLRDVSADPLYEELNGRLIELPPRDDSEMRVRRLVYFNTTLVAGIAGGAIALWRYRVLERREKHES